MPQATMKAINLHYDISFCEKNSSHSIMLTQWFPTYAFLKPDHKKQSDFLVHGVRNQYNAGSEAYLGP